MSEGTLYLTPTPKSSERHFLVAMRFFEYQLFRPWMGLFVFLCFQLIQTQGFAWGDVYIVKVGMQSLRKKAVHLDRSRGV